MFNRAILCYAGSQLGPTDPAVPGVSSGGDRASLCSPGPKASSRLRQPLPQCWLRPTSPLKTAAVEVQELESQDAFTHW